MIVLGLTGEIAAGKSTAAYLLKRLFGFRVFCADSYVHCLYDTDQVLIFEVACLFPKSLINNYIDRNLLAECIGESVEKLKKLEDIVYPFVLRGMSRFLCTCCRNRVRFVALDIPKLYSIGADKYCHAIIKVKSFQRMRYRRVVSRENWVNQVFFLHPGSKRDVSISESHLNRRVFIINNSLSRAHLVKGLASCVKKLMHNHR